jgi:hypothetical protein
VPADPSHDIPRPPEVGEDAAWAAVDSPLLPAQVLDLLDDPERLLRVNSSWVFEAWERTGPDRFRLSVRNLSNGRTWATAGTVEPLSDGLRLRYHDGVKAYTRFLVEPRSQGSRLWVVEDYGRLPVAEREVRLADVDRSLTTWGHDLQRYLRAWARWSSLGPWRWYMERVWRPMKPLGRRVTRLLFWATAAEILLFLGLIVLLRQNLAG